MHATTLTFHQERILAVLLHIQRHLDEDLGLEALAKVAHLSPFHMHRIFKGLVGEGVAEHVRRLRLERAATCLKFGADSVLAIALEAGFESHEAFTRAFTAHFGQAPSRFRRSHHERLFRPSPAGIHYDPHGDLAAFAPLVPPCGDLGVRLIQREPLEVVFARRTGDYHHSAPQAWERLTTWLGLSEAAVRGPVEAYGICHDDPEVTPEPRLRYDAALPWQEGMRIEGDIGRQVLPGGAYLCARVRVPCDDHNGAWEALMAWVLKGSHRLRLAPSMEAYHPHLTTAEGQVVDLLLPVETP